MITLTRLSKKSVAVQDDQFDEERARVSWLRSVYLTFFAVTGFRAILAPQYEIVRRQIREPKVAHIPTFLIDTGDTEDWSHRAFVRFKEPAWQRCWGIAVGHYAVCLPLPDDIGLYERLDAARVAGTNSVKGNAEA